MLSSKKAETGGSQVMAIVLLIALFMVLYILFIPPADREQLLQLNRTNLSDDGTSREVMELLAESPGFLTPTTESATVHRIPSVNVFLKTEPKVINLAQNLFVSRSWFTKASPELNFRADDLDETTKISLFFSVDQASGELRAKINDVTVYSEEIATTGVKIIEIPKSYIQTNNKLQLSVSSPGLAFWSKNKYNLRDVSIKQEFERRNSEESRTFTLTAQEKSSLNKVTLKYLQQCNLDLVETPLVRLDIFVNEQRAHTAEVRCITTNEELELDTDLFVQGSNILTFRLEKGDFTFNNLKIETESRESDRPTYFFSLTQSQFEDIRSGARDIRLHVLLDPSSQTKSARFLINSNELLMQTNQGTFDRDLRDHVLEGTNFIKITPVNSFNLVGLKVTLE